MICTVALMRHGGSHLIRPIVSKMDFDIVEPGNFGAPLDKAQGPVVVFLRDPRDRMCATLRWWLQKPRKAEQLAAAGATDDAKLAWLMEDDGFVAEMLRWARIWCVWPGALLSRFEDMRANGPREVARIAKHLRVEADSAAIYDEVYGRGRTYTGKHSDWRETFGPLSNAAWERTGGRFLLEIMGYE